MQTINVGLVAFGMSARVFHAPFIHVHPNLNLKTVVERHQKRSREYYPYVEVVSDMDTLLEDDEIDLVVVTTPNRSHYDLCEKAINAGKHVVVEKPFTVSTEEADALIRLARQNKVLLSVFQNRRWDGDFLTIKELLKQNTLGWLVEYESHFDRFRNYSKTNAWREAEEEPGSGILYDLGSHLIDQSVQLFGHPTHITADIRNQRGEEVSKTDDSFEIILHYTGPLKITLKAGMLVREPLPKFILNGTLGSYVKYGLDPQEGALQEGRLPDEPGWGQEPGELWGSLNTEIDGLHYTGKVETLPGRYQSYYQNIYNAITGQESLQVSPEQARNVIRLIELAFQSHREGRTLSIDSLL